MWLWFLQPFLWLYGSIFDSSSCWHIYLWQSLNLLVKEIYWFRSETPEPSIDTRAPEPPDTKLPQTINWPCLYFDHVKPEFGSGLTTNLTTPYNKKWISTDNWWNDACCSHCGCDIRAISESSQIGFSSGIVLFAVVRRDPEIHFRPRESNWWAISTATIPLLHILYY